MMSSPRTVTVWLALIGLSYIFSYFMAKPNFGQSLTALAFI